MFRVSVHSIQVDISSHADKWANRSSSTSVRNSTEIFNGVMIVTFFEISHRGIVMAHGLRCFLHPYEIHIHSHKGEYLCLTLPSAKKIPWTSKSSIRTGEAGSPSSSATAGRYPPKHWTHRYWSSP